MDFEERAEAAIALHRNTFIEFQDFSVHELHVLYQENRDVFLLIFHYGFSGALSSGGGDCFGDSCVQWE